MIDWQAITLKKALDAETGDNFYAQYMLGQFYFYGWVVDKDENLGMKWMTKSAKSGLAIAEYNPG